MAKETKAKKSTKEVKPKEKKVKNKTNLFKSVSQEIGKVKWPTKKEVVKYTLATLFLCLLLGAFFELLNLLFAFIKGLF